MTAKVLALNGYSLRFNNINQLANENLKAYHYTFIHKGFEVGIFIATEEWVVPSVLSE